LPAATTLIPAPDFTAPEDEWYVYGANGHVCDVHYDGDHARIGGASYELVAEKRTPARFTRQ
jgi:hypothetical protein